MYRVLLRGDMTKNNLGVRVFLSKFKSRKCKGKGRYIKKKKTYLAALGLSYSSSDLRCITRDLWFWCANSLVVVRGLRYHAQAYLFCGMWDLSSPAAAAAAAKSLQSCPTLCDPIDGSPPGSPVPGILQARTLEWVAISFSISSPTRDQTQAYCISRWILNHWATREVRTFVNVTT